MAITTYAELKTAIQNWLDRDDTEVTDRIDEFIDLAESAMNRDLRIREMEASVTFSLTLGTHDYDIPTNLPGLLDIRKVSLGVSPERTLDYYPPDVLKDLWEIDPNGDVQGYTLIGDNFRVAPAPDATNSTTLSVDYFKRVPALSVSTTTNDILTNHPDLYLYGALIHAEPFVKNDARMGLWKTLYDQAVAAATGSATRGTMQGRPLDAEGI